MAYVIVSAGRVAHSRLRTLPARPVLIAAAGLVLVLVAAGTGLGYRLGAANGATAAPAGQPQATPEMHALVNRVGHLAGRLIRLEQEAATLAHRLGAAPATFASAARSVPEPSGGPLVPLDGIARLEADVVRLEDVLGGLSDAAIERELDSMAFPNQLPIAGVRVPVSSPFGTRHDPFNGRLARHTGLDIPARHGTPILSSGGGRVVAAGRRGAYGLTVVVDHGDGLATLYGHASKLLVRVGDVVLPRQPIALVGSTGRSTGPHLHFEVIRDGRRVEPRRYLARALPDGRASAAP
jgi:murein DD-endopeptidase MepM/ murein hydrolase activator NlpD